MKGADSFKLNKPKKGISKQKLKCLGCIKQNRLFTLKVEVYAENLNDAVLTLESGHYHSVQEIITLAPEKVEAKKSSIKRILDFFKKRDAE